MFILIFCPSLLKPKRAISLFQTILEGNRFHGESDKFKSEVWYSLGVAQQHFGDFQDAFDSFSAGLYFDRLNFRASLNLAAIHHRYGSLDQASKFNVLRMRHLCLLYP